MRRGRITFLLSSLCIVAALADQAAAQIIEKPAVQKIDGRIDWVYDYAQGQRQSTDTGKPMFTVFRCER